MFSDRGLTIIFLFLFVVGAILFYSLGRHHGYNKRSVEVEYYLDNMGV